MLKMKLTITITLALLSALTQAEDLPNAYDPDGNPLFVDTFLLYQDPETKVMLGPDGHRYINTGRFETLDDSGNPLMMDCAQTLLFANPYEVPDFSITNLPGPGCIMRRITTDKFEEVPLEQLKKPQITHGFAEAG
ncbi:hypothetical protein [Photobacterium galatheae]|uniref:Uncharacterized protein n=1 Tax=Photobacterium galatheae TaxID=1654360 RepID=A0A066RRQ5_9GAMM|nr:hypothetical protein [Photobacterium galatheae]KDM93039.1 hypothetical protein EA58_02305 [Photobacterium galatheae]MCM0148432.1 hypothetical protein [Photobacterium galatheae]